MVHPVAVGDASDALFAEAKGVLASGVSASMRLHPYLGRPLYVSRGEGAHLYDLNGKRYIDFNTSNGAAFLGHDHDLNRRFALGCIERGVYFHAYTRQGAPGHAGFSLAHAPEDFAEALDVVDAVAGDLARGRGG